jgi:predicted nucleic acid-binding protein
VRYLLDTSFLIDYLRGAPESLRKMRSMFESGDDLLVSEIVVCEVAAGALPGDPARAALVEPLEFVQPGPVTALLAGRWRFESRSAGRTLSLADALIAAAAHDLDATVLTRNVRDFALTPVRVEAY